MGGRVVVVVWGMVLVVVGGGSVVVLLADVVVVVLVAVAAAMGSEVAGGVPAEAHQPNERAPTSKPPVNTTTDLNTREVTEPNRL